MEGSCYCCGMPVDVAVRYIGFLDMLFGITTAIIMQIHSAELFDRERLGRNSRDYNEYEFTIEVLPLLSLPPWFSILICISGWIQCLMGVLILTASVTKHRKTCQLWLFATAITSPFTVPPFRIFEILVVNEFCSRIARRTTKQTLISTIIDRQKRRRSSKRYILPK